MSKLEHDYGPGVARPKIEDKNNFELKGQFLKEIRINTFSGSDHEDANEHLEKVLEIMDLFHIPNITIDQVMLRAFPMSLTGAASHWLRNKPSGSITTWEDLKTKFLSKYFPPARTAKKMEEINNSQQEPDENLYQAWERFKELLMKQILDSRGAIPSKIAADAKERGFGSLPSSTETNPRDHVKSISTIIEADSYPIRRMGSSQYAVSTRQNRTLIKEKDPGSFTLPCFINNVCFDNALADLGASVSVMPLSTNLNLGLGELAHIKLYNSRYARGCQSALDPQKTFCLRHAKIDVSKEKITLRDGEGKNCFKSVKLIFRPLSLIDYLELNDLNVPLELRRDQVDDLMPTIEECEVIEEFRARNNARMVSKIFRYPSDCDYDKKIYVDYAHNLKFSYMIDFIVLEDMDAYRDEEMGDVIFGEPFLREVRIKPRRFDGMITIYNGNESVTYQMVRLHLRFKYHTIEQSNKIPPLLKVSEEDKMNGISHSYQKLKSFYKWVLNLEEYLEEEVAKTMAETMEQYMSKTRADYGSGVARPKIEDKDNFELKGQFLKELRINTFSGSDHEDANEHIEKVLEIMDLFHIPNITIDQVMLRAFPMSLIGTASHWLRNKPSGSITTWEDLKTKTSRTRFTETSDGLVAIQAQLNNLGREIKKVNEKVYAAKVGCEQYKGHYYTKDCPLKEEGKTLEDAYYTQFDFAVLEDMDAYRDEEMGDVIFGEPFLREVGIKARRKTCMAYWFKDIKPSTIVLIASDQHEEHKVGIYYHLKELRCCAQCLIEDEDFIKRSRSTFGDEVEIHDLNFRDLAKRKEIDEVGEVSIIWNPMCDCSHVGIQTAVQHTSLLINSTWRIYRAKYQGSFSF
ncbi:gag-pol polyprotein [Tanacetum coccineum]